MRTILSAIMLSAIGMALAADARAEITYPWCITGSYKGGARSCIFTSFAQCNAGIHIGGTYCEPNPMYVPDQGRASRLRR